jgi:hypothetical protein
LLAMPPVAGNKPAGHEPGCRGRLERDPLGLTGRAKLTQHVIRSLWPTIPTRSKCLIESEQLLAELAYMVAYWERQAEQAKLAKRDREAATCLVRRDRCLQTIKQVRREALQAAGSANAQS